MMFTKILKCVAVVLVLASSRIALADVMILPPGLMPGDQYRLAFVSNAGDATSADIAVYNQLVTQQANTNAMLLNLNTTWRAVGSTLTVDARDNTDTNPTLNIGVPIYRLDGLIVASSNADLWDGAIANSISLNQNGAGQTGAVWTGTATNGTGLNPFQLGQSDTEYGFLTSTNSEWVAFDSDLSNGALRMYAISGILTATPEPGSLLLAGLSACVLTIARRRRND